MKTKIIAAVAALALTAGCTPRQPHVVDVSPGPLAVQTAACTDETMDVPAVCRELLPLPTCPTEDDVIDGTPGPACYWIDPSTGATWYNDGDGSRASR